MSDTRSRSWSFEIEAAIRATILGGGSEQYCPMQPNQEELTALTEKFRKERYSVTFSKRRNKMDDSLELWASISKV